MMPRKYDIIQTMNYIKNRGIHHFDKEIPKTDVLEILDSCSKDGYSNTILKKESYSPSEIYETFFDSGLRKNWGSNLTRQMEKQKRKREEEIEREEKEEEMLHKLHSNDFLKWALQRDYIY